METQSVQKSVKLLTDKSRLQEIYDLRVTAWEQSARRHLINRELFPNGWTDQLDETAFHFVIEDNNKIVAAARLNIFNSVDEIPNGEIYKPFNLPNGNPFGLFSRLVVAPDHRQLNYSTQLDITRHNYVKQLGGKFSIVITGNPLRINFCLKHGWAILGEVKVKFHPDGSFAEKEYALIHNEDDEISVWGRNLADYKMMFSLSDSDLSKKILSVADGPASFNYEMNQLGYSVISTDPIYKLAKHECEQRIQTSTQKLIYKLKNKKSLFTMKSESETDKLIESRVKAMKLFIDDFERGKLEQRYIYGELPNIPFMDNSFDLCICSNLLFLFEEFFTSEMHLQAINEMLRVANEIRIFPIYSRQTGQLSKHFNYTLTELSNDYAIDIQEVKYEVYKGGNKQLIIKHK